MRSRAAYLLTISLILAHPAFAWESDVHYGLTKWLAMQAGLPAADADIVAGGTLNMDHGVNDARHLVFYYACISRDPQASEHVRDAHFPSFSPLPSKPVDRQVAGGNEAAEREAQKEIGAPQNANRTFALSKFGESLHPLQDSWSHQGIPDTPSIALVSCSEDLSWGHPVTRDGWKSHNADLTHLHLDDTVSTAEATYKQLDAYLAKRNWPRSGKPWASLKGEVRTFAGLDTKSKKKAWFAEQGFTNFDFLSETTLDEGEEVFDYAVRLSRMPSRGLPDSLKKLEADAPEEVRGFFRNFFTAWITARDFESVLARFGDAESLATQMTAELRAKKVVTPDTVAAMLWSWRLRDHGLANRLGHGLYLPAGGKAAEVFKEAANRPKGLTSFKSVEEALVPLAEGAPPYLVLALPRRAGGAESQKPEGVRYAALARFKNAPHDAVLVAAAKRGKDWRIVSMTWCLDH